MANVCRNWTEWEQLSREQKDYATYELLSDIKNRVQRLEERRWMHNIFAFVGGAIGGAAVVVGYLSILSRSLGV
jgi:hypothetical protein